MNNIQALKKELKQLKFYVPMASTYRIKIPYEYASNWKTIVVTIAYIRQNEFWRVGVAVQSMNDLYCKQFGEVKAMNRLIYSPLTISSPLNGFGLLTAKEALYHFIEHCHKYASAAKHAGTMDIVTDYLSDYIKGV